MKKAKIIVLKNSLERHPSSDSDIVITFDELKNWVKRGTYFGHLFGYREALLLTYRLDVLTRPFFTALLLRLFSYGKCRWQDETGHTELIGFRSLAVLLVKFFKEWILKRRVLREVCLDVELLEDGGSCEKNPVELGKRPVYMRTDLSFGIRSGGSVGHIAGVLNNLRHFTGKPFFLSADSVPTVGEDIETHIIVPQNVYWDFLEIPSLNFNRHLYRMATDILRGCMPSFIYQRYSLNNFTGIKLSRKFEIRFVVEYNGSEIWMSRHWGRPLKYETLTERIELLNLRGADVVVVVSQPMRDELVMRGIDAEKILVNPNGVDPDRYSPDVDGSRIRAQYHLDGRTVLGFIGTFGKWHGAEVLAEAFGRLLGQFPSYRERVRLLMVGDGVMMPQVKEHLQKLGALEAATLTGLVPQEQGPAYLAASDILVASHVPNPDGTPFFGSPTKLFEYMAMGKGIVASDLDQIGEVLKHDQTAWMVKPGDAQSLMFGLKALIDDQPMRDRLGRAARQEVVSRYTWKKHTRKIIEKLKERCS